VEPFFEHSTGESLEHVHPGAGLLFCIRKPDLQSQPCHYSFESLYLPQNVGRNDKVQENEKYKIDKRSRPMHQCRVDEHVISEYDTPAKSSQNLCRTMQYCRL